MCYSQVANAILSVDLSCGSRLHPEPIGSDEALFHAAATLCLHSSQCLGWHSTASQINGHQMFFIRGPSKSPAYPSLKNPPIYSLQFGGVAGCRALSILIFADLYYPLTPLLPLLYASAIFFRFLRDLSFTTVYNALICKAESLSD